MKTFAWKIAIRDRLATQIFPRREFVSQPDEWVSPDSYSERLRRRDALFGWALEFQPEFLVTIKYNERLNDDQIRERLRRFAAFLDRHWLGHNWAKLPSAERVFFIAFVESDAAGVHAHLLLRLPPRVTLPAWKQRYFSAWVTSEGRRKSICPRGDIDFREVRSEWEQLRAVSYSLKDFCLRRGNSTEFVISTEFHCRQSARAATRPAVCKIQVLCQERT